MPDERERFQRLNLSRWNASTIEMVGWYEASEERSRILARRLERTPGDVGASLVSFTPYRARDAAKTPHLITAVILDAQGGRESVTVHVRYETETSWSRPRSAPPAQLRREDEFWSLVRELGQAEALSCSSSFVFGGREPDDLWFPLPSQFVGEQGPPDVFELRGVRGAKLGSDGTRPAEYTFTIDRPTSGDVFVDVRFHLSKRLDGKLPRLVLDRGARTARALVGL